MKRKPRGKALPRTDDDLTRLREISPSDAEDMLEMARRDMPVGYAALLNVSMEDVE